MTLSKPRIAIALVLPLLFLVGLAGFMAWPQPLHPVPELARLDPSVDQGRYLATIGNCASCHTEDAKRPYAGGVRFETPFGILYSTNITPDADTGIGRWSFADFYLAMKQGVRPDGTHLYPAFPYTAFAKLSDQDLASLYVYLKTLQPLHAPARPNAMDFPYSLRPALAGWKKLFHDPAAYTPISAQSEAWNRGAYLVQGVGHCGACHSPRNLLGAEREDLALTGGVYMDRVQRGKYREWSGPNLTPHATGLASWSTDDIVAYLKRGENEHAVVHGPMNKVVLSATRHLSDADAQAIATYLKEIPAQAQPSGPPPSEQQLRAGEIGYTVHCGSCHLPSGLGDRGLGVRLAGNALVQAPSPASLINVLLYGPHLPPPPFVVERTRMKPFGKRLSDQDIADIASYVRASFGNQAGRVTAEQVRQQR